MAGGAAGGFVTRALESMLKECANKKYPALQTAIQAYLDGTKVLSQQSTPIESNEAASTDSPSSPEKDAGSGMGASAASPSGNITTALAEAGHTLSGAKAELVLSPLKHAFETKNIKVMELALDCLHKLIAYDHLEGDIGFGGGKNVPLFSDILNMVCSCVDYLSPDSTTIQVLKVLLTGVASTKLRVHGEPLLGVIRVCYNIGLNRKWVLQQIHPAQRLRRCHLDDQSQKDLALGDASGASVEELLLLLLFRTLCKMGIKEDNDEVTTKTRILSLELL